MFGFDSLFYFLVLIGVMILIHELGHYWAARYFDVRVDAFSFGFGPRLFGWRSGDTDFRVSAIPFGGYVKMSGEQPGDEASSDPGAFLTKPRWQRLIIAFAGPFMNILLAVAVLTGLYMYKFPKPPDNAISGIVGQVLQNSPAAKAGIREGDRVVAINGQENPSWQDVMVAIVGHPNKSIPVAVVREGKRVDMNITPELHPQHGFGVSGMFEQAEIMVSDVEPKMDAARQGLRSGDLILAVAGQPIRSGDKLVELIRASAGKPVEVTFSRTGEAKTINVTPEWTDIDGSANWRIGVKLQRRVTYVALNFSDALTESVRENINSASLIFNFLAGIFERRMSPRSLEGPIGIARASAEAARSGFSDYLQLMSAVSLNLAIFNLLPIPILDGGVILVLLMEMFIRKDLSLQVKETVMKFGFVFLMAVVAFVLYNDISKIFSKG